MNEENVVIDPVVKELLESAELGEKAREFLGSKLGDYLIARAKDEADEALFGLASVAPEDANAVRALQFKLKVAESVVLWLGDAIANGDAAMRDLNDES